MKLFIVLFLSISGLASADQTGLSLSTIDTKNKAAQTTTKTKTDNFKNKKLKPLHIEYVRYEEHIYGQSSRSEIGDQMELELSVRKYFTPNTHMLFGFEIDPQENSLTTSGESKAQRFDTFLNHKAGNFTIQAELEIDTNKENQGEDARVDFGGISLGFDDDSEGSFITYDAFDDKLQIGFYPFNFDSEVGDEFNTWDVARIYFIEGAPNALSTEPTDGDVSIAFKTIPGLSFGTKINKNLSVKLAGGLTSFLYPSNTLFNIKDKVSSTKSWEKKQTVGAKAEASYIDDKVRLKAEYAWLEKDKQTGSLLKSAASFNGAVLIDNFVLSGELGISQAGRSPYRLAKGGRWFKHAAENLPIYSSKIGGREHSWVGKTGFAFMAKAGVLLNDFATPYMYYKFQDKNFIFREDESAHNLRNFNDQLSHGGLHRLGLGAQFKYNNFTIRPDLELRVAKNQVFNKSAGIQDQQINSDFRKDDFLFSVVVSYSLKDNSLWGWWKDQGEGTYGKASR